MAPLCRLRGQLGSLFEAVENGPANPVAGEGGKTGLTRRLVPVNRFEQAHARVLEVVIERYGIAESPAEQMRRDPVCHVHVALYQSLARLGLARAPVLLPQTSFGFGIRCGRAPLMHGLLLSGSWRAMRRRPGSSRRSTQTSESSAAARS